MYRLHRIYRSIVMLIVCAVVVPHISPAYGQTLTETLFNPLAASSPDVQLPEVPLDTNLVLNANHVTTWTTNRTHHVLLDKAVMLELAAYSFTAKRAFITITPCSKEHQTYYELAIFLDDAVQRHHQAIVSSSTTQLLVTARISGRVKLQTIVMNQCVPGSTPFIKQAYDRINSYRHTQNLQPIVLPRPTPVSVKKQTTAPTTKPKAKPIRQPRYQRRDKRQSTTVPSTTTTTPEPRPEPKIIRQPQYQQRDIRQPTTVPSATTDEPTPKENAPQKKDTNAAEIDPLTNVNTSQAIPVAPIRAPATITPHTDIDTSQPDNLPKNISFNADKLTFQDDSGEAYATLTGNIHVLYEDPNNNQTLSLSADRAVIFITPGTIGNTTTTQLAANAVQGIYLEDNVTATNGQYTIRAPRIYYDMQTNKAIILKAVFYTWDVKKQVPIYVRASILKAAMQNETGSQWLATNAQLSTSDFNLPHFSIGIENLTINQSRKTADAPITTQFKAKDITFNIGNLPVLAWPTLAGNAADVPLRDIKIGSTSATDFLLNSKWDLFSMAGKPTPQGVDASIGFDIYSNRGAAVGIDLDYDVPKAYGRANGYFMYDTGIDEPSGRNSVNPSTEYRTKLQWQHRHLLKENWEITTELGYISDPTFLEQFFSNEALGGEPYESLVYAKKQKNDWAFTFLAQYDLLDFIPDPPTLQSPGYTVDKLPEMEYLRIGTPLLDNRVTWYSQNSASAMKLNFPTQTPRELGFSNDEADDIFGFASANIPFNTALTAAKYDEDTRLRFDTRQELQIPLTLGALNVVPYIIGRATVYDDDFAFFNNARNSDKYRLYGAGGIKFHTSFWKTYDDVENRMFDVHKIRHLLEPFINIFHAQTTYKQENFPVYDYDIESLVEGTVVHVGMRNTLQTKRGGPERWHSVDLLRLDTNFIIRSNESTAESPIAHYFDYRPEYSLAGDCFYTQAAWQVSDTLAAIADMNYSFESSDIEQWNLGTTLEHNPRFSSFVQIRTIENLNAKILKYGFDYLITPKYHFAFAQSHDLEDHKSRDLTFTVTRRMPRWLLIISADIDEVGDDHSIGIAVVPEGIGGKGRVQHNPFVSTTGQFIR